MKKNGEDLIKNMLGETFIEDLAKFDMINIKTDTAISHEEISDAFKVVPRTVMSWLISNLSSMADGETKDLVLPFSKAADSKLSVTKIANDVYHGEVTKDGKKISKFQYRSIPGIGLVLLTSFELYDVENLIGTDPVKTTSFSPTPDIQQIVSKMIDERLALKEMVDKVVDKKLEEKEAIKELFLLRMASEIKKQNFSSEKEEKKAKKLKLKKFLDKKKKKQKTHLTALKKSECISCPDCGTEIFSEKGFSGCVCFGHNMKSNIALKKTEKGIRVAFSKDWDPENIEMLLKILQKRGGNHE